jgi:hypothetical protein
MQGAFSHKAGGGDQAAGELQENAGFGRIREDEMTKLKALRQHVPLTSQFDHLLRYEASLERNLDPALSQLERLQRLRLGQPVLPKLEVHHLS